jgi:DNA repair protein SbcD/Mre11
MTAFRFIHCSDLHIDSPFKGLGSQVPFLTERLRESTFNSFHNIVKLAMEKEVDAVLIAGDIFDGADRSLQAQLKFRRGLLELSKKNIPSFIVHGNHDPSNSWSHSLEWPETTTIFADNKVESFPVTRDGKNLAWIYGISYSQKEVNENLALKFKRDQKQGFAIGLLHTNVGQQAGHNNYAPCTLQDLISSDFDYWALGHIHQFKILRENNPCIVYSGNTQSRHIKETGSKGCCLVTLYSDAPANIEFVATDVVSYRSVKVDVSGVSSINEVMQAIQLQVEDLSKETLTHEGLVVRLLLIGRTIVHSNLQNPGAAKALVEDIHTVFEGHSPWVLVDLTIQTAGTYDLDSLKGGKDFVAELLSLCDGNDQLQGKIQEAIKPVFESWTGRKYIESEDIQAITLKSRDLALDQLINRENP